MEPNEAPKKKAPYKQLDATLAMKLSFLFERRARLNLEARALMSLQQQNESAIAAIVKEHELHESDELIFDEGREYPVGTVLR